MAELSIVVGGSLEDDARAFAEAWKQGPDRAGRLQPVFSFETPETFAWVLTTERLRLLRHLRGHPAASLLALAKALGRPYRRVHEDATRLIGLGLIERGADGNFHVPFDTAALRLEFA